MNNNSVNDMTVGSPLRAIISFAIPLIMGYILHPESKLKIKSSYGMNNKTHTPNRIFTVEMPAAEIAHFQTQLYGKATVILRYNSMP